LDSATEETLPARAVNSVVQIRLPSHEGRVAKSRTIWHALFEADVRHEDVACAGGAKGGRGCLGLKEEKKKVGFAEGGDIGDDGGCLSCCAFGVRDAAPKPLNGVGGR